MASPAAANAISSYAKDERSQGLEQIIPDLNNVAIDPPQHDPKSISNDDELKREDEEEDGDGSDDGEEDGPSITLPLEQDLLRKDHLRSFRSKSPKAVPTKTYRPSEQQLLQEGKLGDSDFSARLKKVQFGRYVTETGEHVPACLIMVRVDFVAKNRGWFRFREADIEVAFTDERGGVSKGVPGGDDDDADDDDDGEVYTGPLVLKFYPELIRGHTQSASERYQVLLNVPLTPLPAGSPALNAGFSGAWTKEGLHLVHGRLMGEPETRVKWKMHENEVVKGGVYEQPTLAVVVRHREDEPFTMALSMRATTLGGLAVRGKGGARITFKPGKHGVKKADVSAGTGPSMAGLTGGSVQMGGQTWGMREGASTEPSEEDLGALDLEALTRMREVLLGAQGPGSAASSAEPDYFCS